MTKFKLYYDDYGTHYYMKTDMVRAYDAMTTVNIDEAYVFTCDDDKIHNLLYSIERRYCFVNLEIEYIK
jgi:hypothetical protein